MGDAYTPFGLAQVVPVVHADGSIGWQFLGGVNLPEQFNPLTAAPTPDGAVTWGSRKDAQGNPAEAVVGGQNTTALISSRAAGAGFAATAALKAQNGVFNSGELDVNDDGSVTIESSGVTNPLLSLQVIDNAGNSDFVQAKRPSSGNPQSVVLGQPFRVLRGGLINLAAATWTRIPFDTVLLENEAPSRLVGGNFRANAAGVYWFAANFSLAPAGNNGLVFQTLNNDIPGQNNVRHQHYGSSGGGAGAGADTVVCTGIVEMVAGDQISIFVYSPQAGSSLGNISYSNTLDVIRVQ